MTTYTFTVAIECDTLEQAEMVANERLGYDEILELDGRPFDYTITQYSAFEEL